MKEVTFPVTKLRKRLVRMSWKTRGDGDGDEVKNDIIRLVGFICSIGPRRKKVAVMEDTFTFRSC